MVLAETLTGIEEFMQRSVIEVESASKEAAIMTARMSRVRG
jgi:hypothetical protein